MPFKPIGIPKQQWDLIFEEIEPVTRDDGRVLKRYQVKGMPGMACTEEPMDRALAITEQKIKPYKMPETKILFDNTVKDLKEKL